jgi:DNA processing protein
VQETPAPTTPVLPVLDISQDTAGLTDDQIAVLSVLQADIPTLTDDAALLAELPVRRVLSALTVLEIDGYAQRSGPRSYVRTVRLHSEKEGS